MIIYVSDLCNSRSPNFRKMTLIASNMYGVVYDLYITIYNWLFKSILTGYTLTRVVLRTNIWSRINRIAYLNKLRDELVSLPTI